MDSWDSFWFISDTMDRLFFSKRNIPLWILGFFIILYVYARSCCCCWCCCCACRNINLNTSIWRWICDIPPLCHLAEGVKSKRPRFTPITRKIQLNPVNYSTSIQNPLDDKLVFFNLNFSFEFLMRSFDIVLLVRFPALPNFLYSVLLKFNRFHVILDDLCHIFSFQNFFIKLKN